MDTWAKPAGRRAHTADLTRFDSLVRTLPELDDECRAVYRAAVRHGRVALEDLRVPGDRALRCAQMLVEVGLLRADTGYPAQYVAVDPETAFTEILAPAEHRLREAKLHLEETRARLVARLSDYRGLAVPPYAAPATSALRTEASMNRFYANEVERCTSEFVVVRADQPPGGASLPDDLREERLVKRGVVVRSLLSHTAAARFDTRAILRRIRADGAQVRTCDETWGELAIFDRSVMILIPRRQSETGTAALVSREPVLLEYLLGMFESAWNRALVYDIEDQLTYQENKISDIGLAILVHMASGYKDEVIARRLGMSVRTCRGHIARMLRELGADSRFQAGIIAAQRGLLARSTSGDLGGL